MRSSHQAKCITERSYSCSACSRKCDLGKYVLYHLDLSQKFFETLNPCRDCLHPYVTAVTAHMCTHVAI